MAAIIDVEEGEIYEDSGMKRESISEWDLSHCNLKLLHHPEQWNY